jgi:hypothetical protein
MANSRTCRSCRRRFEIAPENQELLSRISPLFGAARAEIPPPTYCPDCRNRRRMAWRNDRTFYLRRCDASGARMVSLYPESTPFPVYQPSAWYSERWDPMDFALEIDFSRPFFEQWRALMQRVPRLGLDLVNCENSDYCNYCGDDKNCYLDIAGEANEDCYYNLFIKYCKDCLDCTFVYRSTLCYECINCYDCYHCRHSIYLENCSDCIFSYDLIGCRNCAFCVNLRNQEYHIYNRAVSREEYEETLRSLELDSRTDTQALCAHWLNERLSAAAYRGCYALNCEGCSGNDIKNSKNCAAAFNASNCEDCSFLYDVLDAKDCSDLNYSLYQPELAYELISTLQVRHSAFNMATHYCGHVFYCDLTNNSNHLFGCIGLNHKSFCILNRQYEEEEYYHLAARLTEHMRTTGEWGEFFPAEISPFAYNETVAQEYMPLTREEAYANGFRWREPEARDYLPQKSELPDRIGDIQDDILKAALACSACGRNFRIIAQELERYRRDRLPAPSLCPQCRHLQRMALRTPRRLFARACAGCGRDIQSTYAPERPERVYCEECCRRTIYGD